jgi:transposase InsO family protein
VNKGQFLIETHLRTGRPIAELARAHGVSRGWLYKLLARYSREGPAGVVPRSRRPRHSPTRIAGRWEEEIVALRKELGGAGLDAGAATISYHLAQQHQNPPSVSTIWRVLRARGFITPQPHKRPKSSYVRFAAELPNECWQADVTHVAGAGQAVFEVLNIIDDHSRLCIASRAFITTRAPDVVRTLHKAAATWGYPESFLTDNGLIFGAHHRHQLAGTLGLELLALGIRSKHSRPYHPQTCGKVERFHQTLKKYLARHDPPETTKQLQAQLDRFAVYYNQTRPHRALGRATPAAAYTAREKAYPTGPRINTTGYRVRHDKLDKKGTVTLRHQGRLHHIPVGRPYHGWRVILLIAGLDIQILDPSGAQLRRLTLDPASDYQALGRP